MRLRQVAKACILIGVGLNSLLASYSLLSGWVQSMAPTAPADASIPIDNKNLTARIDVLQAGSAVLTQSRQLIGTQNRTNILHHYGAWDSSEMIGANQSISIVVELSGELGNHLHHIAHGRAIQTMLWKDHNVASHLVLRRSSQEEKYKRTQRQLQKCFPNLRSLEFHGPQSPSLSPQKSLDRVQNALFDDALTPFLFLNGGSTLEDTRHTAKVLADLLHAQRVQNVALNHVNITDLLPKVRGTSFPFIRTSSMVNRDMMDKFYDEFRNFFEFDERACCSLTELPDPEVPIFHFRNFLGELKKGKKTGLEELSAPKVVTDLFANSTSKSIAIATRFPGRKASLEYFDAFRQQGYEPHWLTMQDGSSKSPAPAMQDFCAMKRTKNLIGMVRSTFVVWAALLGNEDGSARLYSVDSTWTREKFGKSGKPIFRSYNWTHPELHRRIHFELYEAEDLTV